jgi:hypothetical protein
MRFVWLSEQTVTFALYIINRLAFITELESVYCEVHTDCPSGRTMALGSTQPLTEMSTRNVSW